MRLMELRNWLARRRREMPPAGLEAEAAPAWPPAAAEPEQEESPPAGSGWGRLRLRTAEELWGEGFLLPGGAEEVLRLAVPLGLSAASSLLLLGAGSGGPALRLAEELGAWVRGYESDPYLAAVASRRLQHAGTALARRASVELWIPALPEFRRRAFHHALTMDALRTPRPEDVLAALAQAVLPGAQVALLETVAPTPLNAADREVFAWMRLEQRPLPLPDPARIGRALERLGFDVRVTEDVSARHMRQAVSGWRAALRRLEAARPDASHAAALVAEAELWLRRIRLMRAGRLRMVRWFAIRRLGGPA
jgi:cyclopropane fatty-acyl-phospholipid synthase-like methyltransferase